jgi:uncharacterized repeat protein (TIGR01451 family)
MGMRKTTPVVVLVLCALLIGVLAPAVLAAAGGTVGDFEIDGNRPDSPAGGPLDWSTVPNVKGFDDPKKSAKDDVYKDGSKALEPGGWGCTNKSAPAKDDIVKAAIALRTVNGDNYMYVNWERASTNGTANVDYEFSQSNADVAGCPGLPQRTEGDIVLAYDFDNGGNTITIRAFRWHFTAPGVGVYQEDDATLVEHVTYDAQVNSGSAPDNEGNLPHGAFGEASINLTRTIGDICPRFASAYVRTRSSTAITSDPKDRTQKRSDICPPPNPTISKTARTQSAAVGDQVTYDIAYGNSGAGTANAATITDQLPSGTSFVSCTGGCSQSGSTITWSVGPIAPGGGGTVSLTIRVDQLPPGCTLCNTATIDSPQKPGSPDASSQACIRVGPGPNPGVAKANGEGIGVHIGDTGFGIDQTITDVTSTQTGPGIDSHDGSAASVRIPASTLSPPVVQIDVIKGVATSQVLTSPNVSRQSSIAQVVGVNLLNGVITADLIRAAVLAEATGDGSNWNTNGTGFVNLKIDTDGAGPGQPQVYDNANPGLVVDLSAIFGKGPHGERSGVTLREVTGSTTGTFVSDVSETMIHVIAWDRDPVTPGRQTADIYVSRAIAHAEHPSDAGCPGSVSGNAFIASETSDPELVPIVVGPVFIPAYGGHDEQALDQLFLPADGSVLTAELTKSVSDGTLTSNSGTSNDYAELANLCVLRGVGSAGCLVGATLVRSEATSSDTSSGGASSTDDGTQFLNVTVLGTPVSVPIGRNTVISLGPLGYIVLNEQFCDGGSLTVPTCGGATHSGLTVRAIRVVLLDPPPGGAPGLEVIVAQAHSDATAP